MSRSRESDVKFIEAIIDNYGDCYASYSNRSVVLDCHACPIKQKCSSSMFHTLSAVSDYGAGLSSYLQSKRIEIAREELTTLLEAAFLEEGG
jgi:hypothetical protein